MHILLFLFCFLINFDAVAGDQNTFFTVQEDCGTLLPDCLKENADDQGDCSNKDVRKSVASLNWLCGGELWPYDNSAASFYTEKDKDNDARCAFNWHIERLFPKRQEVPITPAIVVFLTSGFYERIKATDVMSARTHHDPGKRLFKAGGYKIAARKSKNGFYITTRSVLSKSDRIPVTFFPSNWSKEEIFKCVCEASRVGVLDVGSHASQRTRKIVGIVDDVPICLIVGLDDGLIVTAYPIL